MGVRNRNSLDVARDAFAALMAGPDPVAVDGTAFPGLPPRPVPLDELRDFLLAGACSPATTDKVWKLLVERSRRDGAVWTVGAVGVALPALLGVAETLSAKFVGDTTDLCDEVLLGFLEALATITLDRPRLMTRLRWSAYRSGRRVLKRTLAGPIPVEPSAVPVRATTASGHPDLVLAQAVEHGVLTRTEADLVGATRVDGERVADWSARREVGLWSAYKRRKQAESRLAAWLSTRDSEPEQERKPRSGRMNRLGLAAGLAVTAVLLTAPPAGATEMVLAQVASLDQLLTNFRNWIMGILGALTVAFLSIGFVRYMLAGDDPGGVEKAKRSFRSAGWGFGGVVLAPLVVQIFKSILGVTS